MAIATINPATGELLKKFDALTDAQVDDRIAKAAKAFQNFRDTSFADRSRWMTKAAEILEAEKEPIGRLMTLEMGKTLSSAIAEAEKCGGGCRYYAEHAAKFIADEVIPTSASKSYIHYQPLGIVLAVMPWNFPFWQVFRFIAPGLMAGNVGLLKHASNVPQCALKIEEILLRAGFPEGVFQTLLIGAAQVDRILNDPRVAAATLTGSEQAGIQVGMSAAKRIKKVVLELGGSDPFIVMPSAKFEEAVATAVKARVINNGQSCIAAKRFIVHEQIADAFEKEFVHRMQSLKLGDPFNANTDVGPLATPDAVKDIDADVHKTILAGAKLLTGGSPPHAPEISMSPPSSPTFRKIHLRIARSSSVQSPVFFASRTSMAHSLSPMIAASALAPAPGPTIPPNASASLTTSNPAWSSSIPW